MYQISLSGTGGQGLILAGVILAEAAVLEGKEAIQTQSYGPEARGGASKADVIISNEEIDYPKVQQPDVLLAMSQEACDKYTSILKPGGKLIVDKGLVRNVPQFDGEVHVLDITRSAQEQLGKIMVANIIALGALAGVTSVVRDDSLKAAVLARVPKGTEELNMKAFELGISMVK